MNPCTLEILNSDANGVTNLAFEHLTLKIP